MSLVIVHEIKANDEARFLWLARALAAASAAEPDTLRYQWFTTQTAGRYAIIEEYVNADAAEAHNKNVESLLVQLFSVIELVSSAFYGELNAYVRDWATGRAGVSLYTPL
jgi:hypothetical protein